MGAKSSFERGAPVLVKVADGRGGHTLQSGTVKDTAGKGAVVRFTNGGHERFVFATDISPDTTAAKSAEKVKAPAHFAEKPKPTIGQLFRAERVSRELTIVDVARMLGIEAALLTGIEDGGAIPGEDLVLKFCDVVGANLDALVDANARALAAAEKDRVAFVAERERVAAIPPKLPAPVVTTPAIEAWVTRMRKLTQAIGTFKADADVVLTHRANNEDAWKVQIGSCGEVGKTAAEAMGKLIAALDFSIADRIATRRKELADLESLSAATR